MIDSVPFRVVAIPDMYKASDQFGIDHQISRFVVPLSAALKGDGSAAFIAACAIFVAQLTSSAITPAMVVIVMCACGFISEFAFTPIFSVLHLIRVKST